MKIKIQKKIKSKSGLLVIPVFKENLKNLPKNIPKTISEFIGKLVKKNEFEAKNKQTISTYLNINDLPEKLLLIGAGEIEKLTVRKSKEMGGIIGKYARKINCDEISILADVNIAEKAQPLTEGIIMSQYEPDKLKIKKEKEYKLNRLNIIVEQKNRTISEAVEKAQLISRGVEYVKDLVNTPSNIVDSNYLSMEARKIANQNKYKILILNEKQLKKLKWGALLAVNQGADKEAKCIVLQHDGGKRNEKPIVIIGKGIIFDSGGYNLKPTSHIETMHQDMAGGAVVLGIFEILKKLKINKNVIGIIPIAENLICTKSYRPSDVIKTFSGLTVEITNTDAEGRLILADAITYGKKLKPEMILSIATLTGAVAVALGDRYAGLLGNDIKIRNMLKKAGRETDDLGWPLPIHRDHKKKLESTVADMRNYDPGTGKLAGCSKAAAFLDKFIDGEKWCHIDIGGSAFTEDPKEYQKKGATAHGFQMLIRFLEKI